MRRWLVCSGVLLLLGTGLVGATALVKMDFADLAREADAIVVASVVATEGQWEQTQRFIHTEVTLAVDRYLRGNGPEQIVLHTPGGTIDGQGMVFHGAAVFEPGERVLVFLTTWEDGGLKVLGYTQGKSTVVEDYDGRLLLRGGVVDGRSLDGVINELRHGPDHMVPLRPAR